MRRNGGIRTGRSIGLALLAAAMLLAACESADKAPAAAAISAAQSALDAVKAEAVKYVPERVAPLENALAAARGSFEKQDYKAVLASAGDVANGAKELGAAVATKKAELVRTWGDLSGGVPKMAEAIQSRVDILAQAKKLPAGLDKEKLDGAKAGLATLNQSWTDANDAYKAGNVSDAIAKAQAAKSKAVEVLTALNMPVPEAAR